jgi:hypothetical protein
MNKYFCVLEVSRMKNSLRAMALTAGLAWSSSASAECLSRQVTDSRGDTHSFQVMAPSREARDYQARGFEVATCSIRDAAIFRKSMCELAKKGNRSVQNRLEKALGIAPARICASAALTLGLSPEAELEASATPIEQAVPGR